MSKVTGRTATATASRMNARHVPAMSTAAGQIGVDDLLMLLSQFGNDCSGGCESDLNADGQVDVDDLLELLGYFGNNCP